MRAQPRYQITAAKARTGNGVKALLFLLWIASIAAVYVYQQRLGAGDRIRLDSELSSSREQAESASRELEEARDRLAVLERADQVQRAALETLQQTLNERQEEAARLRGDIAFYERLLGGGARQTGLAVHSLRLTPTTVERAFDLDLVLTQNLKKGKIAEGSIDFVIEGMQDDALRRLDWKALTNGSDPGTPKFAFKYFQRIAGTVMLPAGFVPNRAMVTLKPAGTERAVSGEFSWDETLAPAGGEDVQQQAQTQR